LQLSYNFQTDDNVFENIEYMFSENLNNAYENADQRDSKIRKNLQKSCFTVLD
jgi:hypothetical protein